MTDPEKTIPPRLPNTPRTWIMRGLAAGKAWAEAHPDWLLAFGLGFLAGVVLF